MEELTRRPPAQASDDHQASVNASRPATAAGTPGAAGAEAAGAPSNEAPAGPAAALALGYALLVRRRRP